MALKNWAALLASVAIAAVSLTASADAAPAKKKYRAYNGPVRSTNGPMNYSYMASPGTRVTKDRSATQSTRDRAPAAHRGLFMRKLRGILSYS